MHREGPRVCAAPAGGGSLHIYRHRAERPAGIYIASVGADVWNVIGRKYLVGGRVQGVFYRATAARHARELRITGYAVNLADGRVEVLAYGSEAALEELTRRLWVGSSASKVTSVEVTELTPDRDVPTDFTTG